MIKLLRANMLRLVKSGTFWTFMALYALYAVLIAVIEKCSENPISSDEMLTYNYNFFGIPLSGALIAFLCSIVFSADFHNGTLRTKIAVGHSRGNIYLANLLTVMIAALALNFIFILITLVLGLPLLGKFALPASTVVWIIVNGSLTLLTYSSIFVLIVMTSKNAIASTIISIFVLAAEAGFAFYMYDTSNIPAYITQDRFNGIGEFIETLIIPLDIYPGDAAHNFCRFMTEFLPSGQCHLLFFGLPKEFYHNPQMALYSLLWIVATSGVGIAIFKKSNIK